MAEGQHQKNIFLFARVPPSKLLGKAKRAGYCSPSVAQIGVFIRECDKRLFPCEGQPQDVPWGRALERAFTNKERRSVWTFDKLIKSFAKN